MKQFHDLCIRNCSEEISELSESLGWSSTSCDLDTVFLEAEGWGELKRKIGEKRDEADVLVFKGGDEDLNRKAAGDSRVDILLHPEKGRKDSGVNHVIAEKAAENRVAIGFDFQQVMENSGKYRSFVLKHWSRNLELCQKFDTPYILTTGARKKYDLRAPGDLKSVIDSLGYSGKKAVSDYPGKILERSKSVESPDFVRPGVEKGDEA